MTDQEKKEFVKEQMANHHAFITLCVTKYYESRDSGRVIPDSVREYTETFMQNLTFVLRLL